MAICKQILFVIMIVVYILFFYFGNHSLREILLLIEGLFTAALAMRYVVFFYKYSQLKTYFWNNLDINDKYVVNYRGHCNASAKEGESLHPLSWYWKDEVLFQQKRNRTIIEFNHTNGKALITIEKLLCDSELMLFSLIIIGCLSFYKL